MPWRSFQGKYAPSPLVTKLPLPNGLSFCSLDRRGKFDQGLFVFVRTLFFVSLHAVGRRIKNNNTALMNDKKRRWSLSEWKSENEHQIGSISIVRLRKKDPNYKLLARLGSVFPPNYLNVSIKTHNNINSNNNIIFLSLKSKDRRGPRSPHHGQRIPCPPVHRHAHQHVRTQKQHLAIGSRGLSRHYRVDLRVRICGELYRVLRHGKSRC